MRNRASEKEEEINNSPRGHGGCKLRHYSLWLVVFMGLILFLAAACCRECAFADEEKTSFRQGRIQRQKLDNGMVVLLKEEHHLPLVSIFLCVNSGSAQEGKFSGCGIAHLVEHMVFKGTARRKPGDAFKEIESFGGEINGFTGYDYTGYSITVPSQFLHPALAILADLMMNATLDAEELEKERQVVLKEIRLNYDDPQRYALRLVWQTAYPNHPYKYPILGEEEPFKRLTRDNLLEYYRQHYVPNNMILALVGDMETQQTLSRIKDIFQDFAPKNIAPVENKPQPKQKELRKQEVPFTSGLTYLRFAFQSVAVSDQDLFALDVLAAALGSGESSRLYQLLCNKKRLAYNIGAVNYTPRDPGLFIISGLLEERHRLQAQVIILAQIQRLKKQELPGDELASAKNKIISDIIFANQTVEAQAQDLTLNEALTGDASFTERYIEQIKKVRPPEVLRVAQSYLNQDALSIVALKPRDEGQKSAMPEITTDEAIGIEHLNSATPSGASANIETNSAKKYVLENGLTVLIQENRQLPLVSITAVFNGGLRVEQADTNGISNLTAQMLDKGTRNKSAFEIASFVESKGAYLSAFSGNNSFGLTLDLLSQDLNPLLELLADLLSNPAFPSGEFSKQKAKNLAELKTYEDNIFASGNQQLKSTLFQKHPYRFLTIGNTGSLKKLRRRDLINFYHRFCVGTNTVIAVFGDVRTEEVLTKVNSLFAKMNPGVPLNVAVDNESEAKAVKTSFKSFAKKQSVVMLGFYGPGVLSRDRYTVELLCQILSQSSGKLFMEIREKAGLAYTLGAYPVLGIGLGYIVLYVATTAENVEEVKKAILSQLNLLKQERLSQDELGIAKRAIIGRKLINRQTNAERAMESALDELYGLGYGHYLEYEDKINQISAEDISRCANIYFDMDNYAVAVVGPAQMKHLGLQPEVSEAEYLSGHLLSAP